MKFGQYGYTNYQRARPLSPDAAFQRPLALGYPMSQPVGTVIAGGLGKKTQKVRKAERALKRAAMKDYEDRLQVMYDKLQDAIRKLTQGTIASTTPIDIQIPSPPADVKRSQRARKLARKIEKLRGNPLKNAIDYARAKEGARDFDDQRGSDRGDVNFDDTSGYADDDYGNTGGYDDGDITSPDGSTQTPGGDTSVVGPDVSNIYYQISPETADPTPQVVTFSPNAASAAEVEEIVDESPIEKTGNWIMWAGGIAGAALSFWGLYEIIKRR